MEPNRPDHIRAVMTVIMMKDGIRAIEPRYPAQTNDWHAFMPGMRSQRLGRIGLGLQPIQAAAKYGKPRHRCAYGS